MTSLYDVPNFLVEYIRVETPDIPCGYFRSVGNSHNAFVVESFLDEMAVLAGRDPVSFRLDLLKKDPRASRLIEMTVSVALKERVDFERGGVKNKNFNSYPILRMDEAPRVQVWIQESPKAKIGGVGEPGLPPTAPAVTNALFAASGRRVRRLPVVLD